jgi:DNA replication protein DnaC
MAKLFNELSKMDACATHGEFESKGFTIGRNTHWMPCPACVVDIEKTRAEEKKKNDAEDEQRRLENKLNKSGIPLRFRVKDFSTYVADTDEKEKALSLAMEFASNFDEHLQKGTFAVFSGKPGTGKSHLAIAIAQAVMPMTTVLYTSAIDAVRTVRDTWRKDSDRTEIQVLDIFASVGLLILDEVGVQYGTEAEQVTLFDIIDKRYRDMMPTVLLTNLNAAGMKQFLGDRSYDRLREGGIWVTFDWESQRKSAVSQIRPVSNKGQPKEDPGFKGAK